MGAETCGKGYIITLPCDDGNTINGDGCSSECQIENQYTCANGSLTSPSVCIFMGDITASVTWMRNTGTVNEGVIALSLSPYLSAYSQMNFSQLVQLGIGNSTFPIKEYSLSAPELEITFDYSFTVESLNATVTIGFDSSYVSDYLGRTLPFVIASTS